MSAITWKDIEYSVKAKKQEKQLLSGISGECLPGEMVAILGSSGAGKSTLLNVLCGRATGKIDGQVLVNGKVRDPSEWLKMTSFVEQDDLFFDQITVNESIQFSANLKLPHLSSSERKTIVTETINELGLINVKDSKIGNAAKRGISGGERKRCAIAVELVTDPDVLFLDEPTSGLDSFIAYNIIKTLKDLAVSKKKTVIMTIHQPRETIVQLFDKIMLLSQGKTVFYGNLEEGLIHFEKNGYPCPENTNPANFFIDLITIDYRTPEKEVESTNRILRLQEAWKTPELSFPKISDEEYKKSSKSRMMKFNASWPYEMALLLQRDGNNIFRNPATFGATIGGGLVSLVLFSVIYYDFSDSPAGIQNRKGLIFNLALNAMFGSLNCINYFPAEKPIIRKERSAGMYRAPSAYLSKVLANFPLIVLQVVVLSLPIYWIVGFRPDAGSFLLFLLIIFVETITATFMVKFIYLGIYDRCFGAYYHNWSNFWTTFSCIIYGFWRFVCESRLYRKLDIMDTIYFFGSKRQQGIISK
eukprot:NODE_424_length_7676_cov_0.895209.p2 type:complete len:529 gc:universal NODE_424_length_7676_cov_0.895209:2718-4304(+)